MFIKDLNDCPEFIASDKTVLKELLHPDKQNIKRLPLKKEGALISLAYILDACIGVLRFAQIKIRYSLAHAIVKPHEKSAPHKLKTSEVYYILEGEGIMHIDNETAKVKPGQAIYIPPNSKQFIENTGKSDLKFLCIVDPAWKKEDEVVL